MTLLRLVAIGSILVSGAAACTVQTRTTPAVVHGYSVVEADRVPDNFSSYPHTRYDDRDVYLVDGRWYYPTSSGAWVVFHDEPPPLYEFRARLVVNGNGYANGGYGNGGYVSNAPNAPRPVSEAPPAYPQGPAYPPPPPR